MVRATKRRLIRPMKLPKSLFPSILPTVASIIARASANTPFQSDWTLHKSTHFPLHDCSLVLHLLEKEGFLTCIDVNLYSVKEYVVLRCDNCSERYDPTTAKVVKDIDQWLSTTEGPVCVHDK